MIGDLVDLARDGEPAADELEELRLDDVVTDAVARAQLHAPGMRFLVSTEPTDGPRLARPRSTAPSPTCSTTRSSGAPPTARSR